MPISFTAFGGALLPVLLFVLLFRRGWMLPLFATAAILQGPAAALWRFQERDYGISAFLLMSSLVAVDLLLRARAARAPVVAMTAQPRASMLASVWLAMGVWALQSSIVLPWLFSGVGVYPPLDKEGVHGELQSLSWSISHGAQAINLLVIAMLFLWVWLQRHDPRLPRRALVAMIVACALAAAVGLQQRLAWNGLVPLWSDFWASNPTYAQNFQSMAGTVPRVSWPFVEASYASAFFAATFGGFFTLFLADIQRHKALGGVMVSLFALANTLGATGLLAALTFLGLTIVVVFAVMLYRPAWGEGLVYRLGLAALAASCLVLGGFLVIRHYDLLQLFSGAAENVLAGRSQTFLGDIRPHADLHSLRLLWETCGMGAGMGSHRGSSYLVTFAANTGIVGLILFLVAISLQTSLLVRRVLVAPDAAGVFFLGAGVAMLIGVTIAIPDQNWPVLWIVLLGGFVCVVCPVPQEFSEDALAGSERGHIASPAA